MSVQRTLSHVGYPVANGNAPLKGSRAMRVSVDFSVFNPYAFDLVEAIELDQLEFVQAIYCDNSANPYPFQLTIGAPTNQVLTWPAYSQGYIPCLASEKPRFSASTTGTPTVHLHFLNFPVPLAIWGATGNGGTSQTVYIGGSTGTDHSANKPSDLANLVCTINANASRSEIEIQNQYSSQLQVKLDDGAGNNISYVLLAAGSGANTQGGTWSSMCFKGRARVYAGSALAQVMAREC